MKFNYITDIEVTDTDIIGAVAAEVISRDEAFDLICGIDGAICDNDFAIDLVLYLCTSLYSDMLEDNPEIADLMGKMVKCIDDYIEER